MTRKYELKRRAERQEETKQRIVEAAIALHSTKGPARTTLTDVARLAGVQRHTLYRHFADERELGLACSGRYMETNRPPDATAWRDVPREERLRHGLELLYGWYDRNHDMLSCVLRDAEVDPLTRELFELRAAEPMAAIRAALAEVVSQSKPAQAALELALDFRTWQRLAGFGLTNGEAAETMIRSIGAQ
jgi:AcrR family transcriptional regulator